MKYIIRILVLPFVFGIVFIFHTIHVFNRCRLFLLYGGEWSEYAKNDRVTMQSIYLKLKENAKV